MMKAKLLAGIAVLLMAASAAQADLIADTIVRWYALNDVCRGPGPAAQSEAACRKRDSLSDELVDHGFCIYGHGVIGVYSKNKRHCYERKSLWPKD
jgi:hypothetical protein